MYTHMEYMEPETKVPVDFAVDMGGMDVEREEEEEIE